MSRACAIHKNAIWLFVSSEKAGSTLQGCFANNRRRPRGGQPLPWCHIIPSVLDHDPPRRPRRHTVTPSSECRDQRLITVTLINIPTANRNANRNRSTTIYSILTLSQITPATIETAAGSITVKEFTYTDNMRYTALYLLFAYFWTSEFIVAMGQVRCLLRALCAAFNSTAWISYSRAT